MRKLCCLPVVARTLAGIHRVHGAHVNRKRPLVPADLHVLVASYGSSPDYDDLLFLMLTLVGFDQLLHLAELCAPDDNRLFDVRRSMKCFTVTVESRSISILLPAHKVDKFFSGSHLLICPDESPIHPHQYLLWYLTLRDRLFPWHPELWLRADSSVPTRSWFTSHLRQHFDDQVSRHSMRAGGATALAAAGVPDDRICTLGRWSSDSYQLYIQKHPLLLLSHLAS